MGREHTMEGVSVEKVAGKLQLSSYLEDMDLKKCRIRIPDVNRPALQLSGYFEHFEQSRVQIIGMVEYTYLEHLDQKEKENIYRQFLNYDIPCVIFAAILGRMICSFRSRRRAMSRFLEREEVRPNLWRS